MSQPNSEDVYSMMGFALCQIQATERTFKFITTYVLQDGDDLDIEKLQSINKRERKRTLGYFMVKIRGRAQLHPSLDILLQDYLDDRNDFIHNQRDIPNWNLDSEEGTAAAKVFIMRLIRKSHKISEILMALIINWQAQTGINLPDISADQDYFDEIDQRYGHLVDVFFSAKPPAL